MRPVRLVLLPLQPMLLVLTLKKRPSSIKKFEALYVQVNPKFGVDLAIPADPKENPNARKTNHDYTVLI